MTGLDPRSVARALGGDAYSSYALVPGPGHSGRDRSLLIEIDPSAPEGFTVHTFSVRDDWKQCRDYVRERLGLSSSWRRYPEAWTRRRLPTAAPIERRHLDEGDDRAAKNGALALRLWHEAGDPRGTIVEARLRRHRCGIEIDAAVAGRVIRYHSHLWHAETRQHLPGMLALYRRIDDDAPVAIHRTFIGPDGRKIDRKMLGPVTGAVIKLDADEDVTFGLFLGEGVETSLAARQMGLSPAWATGSAGAIAAFPVLPGVDALTVLGEIDRHDTNLRGAHAVERRWRAADREVFYTISQFGKDMNDALAGGRAEG